MYLLACAQIGLKVRGFTWDVLLKPSISPKKLSKADITTLETTGSYCDLPYKGEGVKYGDKEDAKLFGMRVFQKYIEEADKQFQRVPVVRTKESLFDYLVDMNKIASGIQQLRESVEGGNDCSIRNLTNCKSFNRLCEYHPICSGYTDKNDTTVFQTRDSSGRGTGGPAKGSLSTSQMNLFMGCQRRWVYKYVEKIERAEEWTEALYFGDLVHKALEIILEDRLVDPIEFPNSID